MKACQILPTALIVIDVFAAGVYLWNGDIRKVIYWIAAAVLTGAVTY